MDEPLVVFGKVDEVDNLSAVFSGKNNNGYFKIDIPINLSKSENHPSISSIWGRKKIASYMDEWHLRNDLNIKQKIIDIALAHNLVSKFTSFVAVEQKIVNPSGKSLASALPTELPDGWNFDKVFGKNSPMTLSALPHTATNKPFYLLIGLLLISLSVLVRFTRANSI